MSTNLHSFRETDLRREGDPIRASLGLDVIGITLTKEGASLKTAEGKRPEIVTATAEDIVNRLK
jgi:hypothetical protein